MSDLPAASPPRRRIVVIVDDGIATGSSMLAAIRSVRARKPLKLIVAIGVAPAQSLGRIEAAPARREVPGGGRKGSVSKVELEIVRAVTENSAPRCPLGDSTSQYCSPNSSQTSRSSKECLLLSGALKTRGAAKATPLTSIGIEDI